ncbi:MAG: hypothetical protein WCA23_25870, partial [Stellaceae bacterium]
AKEGLAQAGMGWGAAQVVGLNCEEWMDWYRDGEDTQQAPVTTESKPRWTHSETGTRSPRKR